MRATGPAPQRACYGKPMSPTQRRRAIAISAILLVVVVLAAAVLTQPGSTLRTRFDLARVERQATAYVLFLDPGAAVLERSTDGYRLASLRPVQPVWRYEEIELHVLPGATVTLPEGRRLTVGASGRGDDARATFTAEAGPAMTASGVLVDDGRTLDATRVRLGEPVYAPIDTMLEKGWSDRARPQSGEWLDVRGRGTVQRLDHRGQVLVVRIPSWESEGHAGPAERQYGLLTPETLYFLSATDDPGATGPRPIPTTAGGFVKALAASSEGEVSADLEQRGSSVFVLQVRMVSTD